MPPAFAAALRSVFIPGTIGTTHSLFRRGHKSSFPIRISIEKTALAFTLDIVRGFGRNVNSQNRRKNYQGIGRSLLAA
jgi:hypothetical protein